MYVNPARVVAAFFGGILRDAFPVSLPFVSFRFVSSKLGV